MASTPGGGKSPFDIDLTEIFARMKLPLMPDMEALVAAQRRSLEIMQQTMAELSESRQAMASCGVPSPRPYGR